MKIVTSFIDIGRQDFRQYSRTSADYLEHFSSGIGSLDAEIVAFVDEKTSPKLERLVRSGQLVADLQIHPIQFEDLPFSDRQIEIEGYLNDAPMRFYSLRDSLPSLMSALFFPLKLAYSRAIRANERIWSELAPTGPRAPEYLEWRYLVTTWSKPFILHKAYEKGLLEANEQAIFADFGLGHGNAGLHKLIRGRELLGFDLSPGEILLLGRGSISSISNPWQIAERVKDDLTPAQLLQSDMTGAGFLSEYIKTAVTKYFDQGLVLDDQTLFSLFRAEFPDRVRTIEVGKDQEMVENGLVQFLSQDSSL